MWGLCMNKSILSMLLSGVFLSGCATMVGDKTQLIPISSSPSDASISIIDEKGLEVFKGSTPTTVTLSKSDGSYFGGKTYTVKISKPGYRDQLINVDSSANGWYIAGNLVFGGLIGWLIVDPFNGAMYTLTPEQVNSSLSELNSASNNSNESITVVLLEDVPESLKSKLVRLN